MKANDKRVADIAACNKVKEGVMKNFSIEEAAVPDHFAYDFRTLVKIPERGVYRFYTFSDDGSKLYIDGKLIVDNDGWTQRTPCRRESRSRSRVPRVASAVFRRLHGPGIGSRVFGTECSGNRVT